MRAMTEGKRSRMKRWEPTPTSCAEGKDNVRELLAEFPTFWDDLKVSPNEFVEEGDTVVVLGHLEGRGKETGKEVKLPFVHVWRFSDGKVTRMQNLTDTALAAEALGRI